MTGTRITKIVTRSIATMDGGVKKFSTDVMPNEVLEAAGVASNAMTTAEAAQSTADSAKSTAEAAQSTVNGAIANSITKTDGGISSGIIGGVGIHVKYGEDIYASLISEGIRFYQQPSQTLYTRIDSTGYSCFGLNNGKYVRISPNVGSSSSAYVKVCNSPEEYVSIDANGKIFVINSKNTLTLFGATGIVIGSSTPNSSKKFKITVDDAGVISATEVTS